MNNDLISREALIEAITSETRNEFEFICLSRLFEIIDNAPTVKAFTEEDMAGAYNEGYACGCRESKRPQGEWIIAFHDCTGKYYLCSSCKEGRAVINGEDYASLDEFRFCPHCGADMRGENS